MKPKASSASVFGLDDTTNQPGVGVIKLDGYVSASAVEDRIAHAGDVVRESPLIYIDLSHALHFDIAGLLHLLSVIADRRASNRQTMFRLPNDVMARHILRLWDFPKAVGVVAQAPFRLLVERDDWEHFGEDWPVPPGHPPITSPQDSVLAYLVERRSFGLTPYRRRGNPGLERLIQDQITQWSNYAVASLLSALLPAPPADFVRVVVREMLANVIHNASPTLAVVGSQLDLFPDAGTGAPAGLSIGVWHDGRATVDLFTACARKIPAEGIQPPIVSPADVDTGIVALCRTSVETFGGSVIARGGRHRVVIEPRAENVHLTRSVSALSAIFGDLVTVRLPIKNA